MRIIQPILNRENDERQHLGVTKKRLEMMDTLEFEGSLQTRVERAKFKIRRLQ